MPERGFAPDQTLSALLEHGVDFIVVGGIAADVHGAGWATFDLDIVIATSDDSLVCLMRALAELEAIYNLPDGRRIEPDLERLVSIPGPQLFRTKHGRLDVLKEAGGETYESLVGDAAVVEHPGGGTVRFASVRALIRMKRAANRPKDAQGIAALEALLASQDDD